MFCAVCGWLQRQQQITHRACHTTLDRSRRTQNTKTLCVQICILAKRHHHDAGIVVLCCLGYDFQNLIQFDYRRRRQLLQRTTLTTRLRLTDDAAASTTANNNIPRCACSAICELSGCGVPINDGYTTRLHQRRLESTQLCRKDE